MRRISASLEAKLRSTQQTRANNSDPSLDLWIGRPTTALTDDAFLERQQLPASGGITQTDVAVAHPIPGRSNTSIHVAYIQDGVAHVAAAAHKSKMSAHTWADTGFSAAADDVAISYDGSMPIAPNGRVEFKTAGQPWVFWTNNGALYARQLGMDDTVTLAEANCTAVTAVRATRSNGSRFNFGLVVFFILGGSIYYRQLIGGEWMDAELVSFGPGKTWTDIAAGRTWDYRVALQCKASDGSIYELFTQFGGIGSRNQEHLELRNVEAAGELSEIGQTENRYEEHVEVSKIDAGALYGGLYGLGQPTILSASNLLTLTAVDGEEVENYGLRISVHFAEHLNPDSVEENLSAFVMRDSIGTAFTATKAETVNGLDWVFTLPDFNNAIGDCTVSYVPGTLHTMAGTTAYATAVTFAPENLMPSDVEAPKIINVYNTDSTEYNKTYGKYLAAVFDGSISAPTEADLQHFSVTAQMAVMGDDGNLILEPTPRTIVDIVPHPDVENALLITLDTSERLDECWKPVVLAYDGSGSLRGYGRPVAAFKFSFDPEDIAYKGEQNDSEHVTLHDIMVNARLLKIRYIDSPNLDTGHVALTGITATGFLTYIDDI